MKAIDFAGYVGALVGVGAALDFAMRASWKQSFVTWVSQFAAAGKPDHYGGSQLLDRFFGPRLLSRKAVPLYVLVSLLSIAISYGFAVATSPQEIDSQITIFPAGLNTNYVIMAALCLLGAIVGDVLSYSKTRIFVRAVDKFKTTVVSVGLAVADLIISLAIFVLVFSLVRTVCYVLVLSTSSTPPLTSSTTVFPELIREEMQSQQMPVPRHSERYSQARFAALLSAAESRVQFEGAVRYLRLGERQLLQEPARNNAVRYAIGRRCFDPNDFSASSRAFAATAELMGDVTREINATRATPIDLDQQSRRMFDRSLDLLSNESECTIHITTIRRTIPANSVVGMAGPVNAYLAGLERTMFDAYHLSAFKFAFYISFDPYDGIDEYLYSIGAMVQTSFLMILPVDEDAKVILSEFEIAQIQPQGVLNIPFAPMLASALSTSYFFAAYLMFLLLATVRAQISRGMSKLLPAFDLNKAVFTTFSVAICFMLTVALLVGWAASMAWSLAFA